MNMLILPSISKLKNWDKFNKKDSEMIDTIIVIDETTVNRYHNEKLDRRFRFYGKKERSEWFKSRNMTSYEELIPEKAHAETSFGLLLALEEQASNVFFIDDDIYPDKSFQENFFQYHLDNLNGTNDKFLVNDTGMFNVLLLTNLTHLHPRGFPYSNRENRTYRFTADIKKHTVLSQGLWSGMPDLDSVTIMNEGSNKSILQGICEETKVTKCKNAIIDKNCLVTVCSMNLAFKPEIIPAFYQLPMTYLGIDRFDDIWSGIFVKVVMDQLDTYMCAGKPVCVHDKRPRSIFKDLIAEADGIAMNDYLWELLNNDLKLVSKTYSDCYVELAEFLELHKKTFSMNDRHEKFITNMTSKMKKWVDACDKIQ